MMESNIGQRQNDYYMLQITRPLNHFREYASFIEKSFENEVAALKEVQNFEGNSLFNRINRTQINAYDVQLPTILRSSLLISVYSFLESTLRSFCIPGISGKEFEIKDNNVTIIEQAMDHLKYQLGLEFDIGTSLWKFVRDTTKIRNCFTHAGGNISAVDIENNKHALLKVIENNEHVSKDGRDNIILHKTYCIEFIEVVSKLFVYYLSKNKKGEFYSWFPLN